MSVVRIGISGWSYPEWRGGFYPKGLVQKNELRYAGECFNSIEINGTFYSLQTPKSFQKWASEVPDDLVFAVKGSKFITHQKRLKDVRIPVANFFASGLLALGGNLGPIVWQFSPWFRYDRDLLEAFLKLLPRTTSAAAELANENTIKAEENVWTEVIEDTQIRYAFEPRHESFFTPDFVALMAEYNAAIVFADTADKFAEAEDVTSDFLYFRLHGNDDLYASNYSDAELDTLAKRISIWKSGGEPEDAKKIVKKRASAKIQRDVYVYFDNSMKGHAPHDAMYLAKKL
ncbi:MAG TPA: DUF72 domain-containing protein, partial [Pyrinomonadaceae bacterium]|nr:DUF72 domain-containing protein [Pyrinomonadaceae bacterium]